MQSARWCFTVNNYTQQNKETCQALGAKYLCYGCEVAPSTGTPHLQGYVVFKSNQRFSAVKKKFPPGTHLEVAKGSTEDNIKYCTKEGDFFEQGDRPLTQADKGKKERERWQTILEHAKAGTLEEHDPKVYFLHLAKAEKLYADNATPLEIEKTVKVYYGVTGSGKSHAAWTEAGPDAYVKDPRSKFWYGYKGQTAVIIDEFRGGIDIAHMLRWLDKWPTMFEIKNSSRVSKVSHIWITSNLHPKEWYPECDSTTVDALLRRLQITEYATPYAVHPATPYGGYTR